MGQILTTVAPLAGGVSAVTGVAMQWRLELNGTWAADDYLTALLTGRLTAASEAIGYGPATGIHPVFLKTFKRKLYIVAGTALFFSALDQPETLNKLNTPGNSFIELANEYGFADDLLAVAIFRRQMAILGRQHIQIWNIDPDPAQNSQAQTLENEGTVNGASVRGLGTLDVLYLADSGVRSLAARANSEDAVVQDLGTPIDTLIQAALDEHGATGACSIVEPRTRRYWLALGSTIYVFSYFPSSSIVAWSKYEATQPKSPVSAVYSSFPGGYWTVSYTGLTVGRTYRFTRGTAELAGTSCFIADGVNFTPYLTDQDGTFVATETTARVFVQADAQPANATALVDEFFTPEKFVVFDGQIFVLSTDGQLYRYGGADNATYDASVCSWETPWLDARSPGTQKPARGVDAGMEGAWRVKLGTDPSAANPFRQVLQHTGSTFKLGSVNTDGQGTHFKVRAETTGSGYARFGMFVYHFERGNQR